MRRKHAAAHYGREDLPKLAEGGAVRHIRGRYSRQRHIEARKPCFGIYKSVYLAHYLTALKHRDAYGAHAVVEGVGSFNIKNYKSAAV